MQRIINFILSRRNTFLYLLLLFIGMMLTVQSHSYHQSRYFNSSNWVSGQFYQLSGGISAYFDLRTENQKLMEENRRLREWLSGMDEVDSLRLPEELRTYEYIPARINKNSITSYRNYLTINRGSSHGIEQDMAVITPLGVLGIIENTSQGFSTVQSLLNDRSSINAKIKGTDYFGSLTWDGESYRIVQLNDIPKLVPIRKSDTIITGGMSSIFPPDIPIGVVVDYKLPKDKSFYEIEVQLFNDMANIRNVYVIRNNQREEILNLQNQTENVE